jgi:hypothetical protein
MSDTEPALNKPEKNPGRDSNKDSEDEPGKGPNLMLIYSLIALALAVAIGFAALIVLPFYHRR